jgi:hypothetical protein
MTPFRKTSGYSIHVPFSKALLSIYSHIFENISIAWKKMEAIVQTMQVVYRSGSSPFLAYYERMYFTRLGRRKI